jgi:hypothetical protein
MSSPGSILPGGIVLIDEPASLGVATFRANGEVLLTFSCRPGDACSQVIFGLSAHQAVQLTEALQKHGDACLRAIAEGKGGARFPEAIK